ncbi:Protein of unknown function (DUF2726) [Azospira oryzae PS]|uniref:DUF2726 domain-containing protein n=1 Tax=Azospira oryzae (strain ATCC BAA-33 / DSM 13638 / PS) TaxID=640081 RepID=G8QN61_AZOOP|nr:DUF2726 domain-containing protein [Azospira oryzae]AEV26901.1 Protein of unknown function (DUF2726) [Azospira oryzae PS]
MNSIFLTLFVIAAIIAITKPGKRRSKPRPLQRTAEPEERNRPRYRDKFNLLNKAEQELFERLTNAMDDMHVFTQVSMSQLFHISGSTRDKYIQIGEVGRKSVDFLICRRDFSIVLAVELNGPMHGYEDRKKSDETKARTLEDAGIPLAIFYPDKLPTTEQLMEELKPLIKKREEYEKKRDWRYGRTQ